jgi:murein DD-endopeptidase MepM/ murein hydrolase activator NlpD
MADGLVIRSRFESALDSKEGAGLYILQLVMLPGYDSWVLKYSHLKGSHAVPGQTVRTGDPLAESGNTGAVLSPYLHVDLLNLRHRWQEIPFEIG